MTHRVLLPLVICTLVLAGCYRQAGDEFEQVNSQSVQSLATPTINPALLTPIEETEEVSAQSAEEETPTETSAIQPSKTPDPADIDPTDDPTEEPTSIQPATNIPAVVPTATRPSFVTPEPPPGQVVQPTVVPPTATATQNIVPPTATEFGAGPSGEDECVYEVASGDNLFRIAINNDTSVEEIQQLNSLESDAIQVGQLLRIPGCVPGQAQAEEDDAMEEADDIIQPIATATRLGGSSIATVESPNNLPSAGQQVHVVVSGETLGAIARRYGTSINAIVELNELANPDSLSVGQELLIPASN